MYLNRLNRSFDSWSPNITSPEGNCDLKIMNERLYVFALFAFQVVVMIVGGIGNSVVCLTILRTRAIIQKNSAYLILNLAVADLLIIIIIEPLGLALVVKVLQRSCVFTLIFALRFLSYTLTAASMFMLSLMSVDRCFVILYPLKYKVVATRTRVKYTIAVLWLLSLSTGLVKFFKVFSNSVCAILTQASIILCLSIIITSYMLLFLRIKRQSKVRAELQNNSICVNARSHEREKRLAKTVAVVILCFVLCWTPITFALTLWPEQTMENYLYAWASMIGLANSAINPIIYFYGNKDFRNAAKTTCRGILSACNKYI